MNKPHNNTAHTRQQGLTLVELLVAVAVTSMMLVIVGMVFNSAGKAAGKTQNYNAMMQQVRTFTQQLDRDFAGLMTDMPMVIQFETHAYNTEYSYDFAPELGDPDDEVRLVHYDRIVFFSRGDFQSVDGQFRGDMARIFYGQSADTFLPQQFAEQMADPDVLNIYPVWFYEDNWSQNLAPPRKILARKAVVSITDTTVPDNGALPLPVAPWAPWTNARPFNVVDDPLLTEFYDHYCIEHTTQTRWQDELDHDYLRPDRNGAAPWYPLTVLEDHPDRPFSWLRRPNFNRLNRFYQAEGLYPRALQEMYMLPDVTDFRIALWFNDGGNSSGKWINWDRRRPAAIYLNFPTPNLIHPIATFNASGDDEPQDLETRIAWSHRWPTAIRFTFTLHDNNRRYFPEGRTFEYIVEVPRRAP